jgi:hypothetical protein
LFYEWESGLSEEDFYYEDEEDMWHQINQYFGGITYNKINLTQLVRINQ